MSIVREVFQIKLLCNPKSTITEPDTTNMTVVPQCHTNIHVTCHIVVWDNRLPPVPLTTDWTVPVFLLDQWPRNSLNVSQCGVAGTVHVKVNVNVETTPETRVPGQYTCLCVATPRALSDTNTWETWQHTIREMYPQSIPNSHPGYLRKNSEFT